MIPDSRKLYHLCEKIRSSGNISSGGVIPALVPIYMQQSKLTFSEVPTFTQLMKVEVCTSKLLLLVHFPYPESKSVRI